MSKKLADEIERKRRGCTSLDFFAAWMEENADCIIAALCAADKTWVGLTDEEFEYGYTLEKKFAMQYVDAKLKAKNA